MNVLGGPNEAGKSSWHAAIRAAITGVKRGRGRPSVSDSHFDDLHRPWNNPDEWKVEARLVLDDGRAIDMMQDLAGKVASRATDIALGRDVSTEIIHDGSPDASRWLGLDREAFAATICVEQDEILAIARRETADLLQQYLQRAAASRATDATAAEAIERLDEFRRTSVGTDHVASKGPLRQSRVRLETARAQLQQAQNQHAGYMVLMAQSDQARTAHAHAANQVGALEALLADREAKGLRARADRAFLLSQRYPGPPVGAVARSELADRVAAAVSGWKNRPVLTVLTGPAADEIDAKLHELPTHPVGDLRPEPAVISDHDELIAAEKALGLLGERPALLEALPSGSLTEAEVRSLANDLRAELPEIGENARQRLDLARERAESLERRRWLEPMGLLLLLVVAAVGVAIGVPAATAFALLVGVAVAYRMIREGHRRNAARHELHAAEADVEPVRVARSIAEARRAEALSRARQANLPTEPEAVTSLADELGDQTLRQRAAAEWDSRHTEASRQCVAARDRLRESLAARRGVVEGRSEEECYEHYVADCDARANQAVESAQADALRAALEARRQAEASAKADADRLTEAEAALRSVAAEACGESRQSPDELVGLLETWQRTRGASAAETDQAMSDWHELQALLEGSTLGDLQHRAQAAEGHATELSVGIEPQWPPAVEHGSAVQLSRLRAVEGDLLRTVMALETRRDALAGAMVNVAEAEEEALWAELELERIDGLATVVDTTTRLLTSAQERVHRDIAPVIAASMRSHIAAVTEGRYTDVAVDPADLGIGVKEARTGQWRLARLLSGGTREQIYLLLRAVMARHLVTTDETAPLLLDEVTAQSDAARSMELMRTLLSLSSERQIIVFTHDEAVVTWAEANLAPPQHRVFRLPPLDDRAGQ